MFSPCEVYILLTRYSITVIQTKVLEPVPYVPYPRVFVDERELIDAEYIDVTRRSFGNGTVRVKVRYNPPPGWSLKNKEYTAKFIYSHLIQCPKCEGNTPSFAMPIAVRITS